jgi:hypothetical protein
MYTVTVVNPPSMYQKGYFPRKFRYCNEARGCAITACENGATSASVSRPDGAVIDIYQGKEEIARKRKG